MQAEHATELVREALLAALVVGGPLLLVGLAAGLLLGLLQALTQIQDQSLAFVPKLLLMMLVLSFCLPWLLQFMIDYSQTLIGGIPGQVLGH